MVQLSHSYIITGKTIALTRWAFFGKVMSLLFNMLSRLVITFLSRSKCLLISWLQTPSFPLQLEKNHEINLSTLDEVHFCCSASRAILSSLSKLKRRLDSLYATQEVPRDTLCNSRGTPTTLIPFSPANVFRVNFMMSSAPRTQEVDREKGNPAPNSNNSDRSQQNKFGKTSVHFSQ